MPTEELFQWTGGIACIAQSLLDWFFYIMKFAFWVWSRRLCAWRRSAGVWIIRLENIAIAASHLDDELNLLNKFLNSELHSRKDYIQIAVFSSQSVL